MFYVYVLQSESDEGLYIGFSTDLRKRMKAHEEGRSFSTSYRGPWRLIYYEAYLEEKDALGREKYLKSGGGSLSGQNSTPGSHRSHNRCKHPSRPTYQAGKEISKTKNPFRFNLPASSKRGSFHTGSRMVRARL
jgi:putative endonuclease